MSAPGQVVASNQHFHGIAGMPTEADIAKDVKALPVTVQGKLMHDGIRPCTDIGQVIKFSIEHGKWTFFQMKDTYSVTTDGEPFADGVYIKEYIKLIGGNRTVVYDKDNKPIALAVQDAGKMLQKAYTIYGTNKIYDTDKVQEKEDGIDFYPWYRVRDIDSNHIEFRSLLAWNGSNFQTMFRIVPALRHAEDPNLAKLLPPRKSDNIIVNSNDPTIQYALLSKKLHDSNVAGWDACVAPGVDPLAILILTAVMDAMVGWFA